MSVHIPNIAAATARIAPVASQPIDTSEEAAFEEWLEDQPRWDNGYSDGAVIEFAEWLPMWSARVRRQQS